MSFSIVRASVLCHPSPQVVPTWPSKLGIESLNALGTTATPNLFCYAHTLLHNSHHLFSYSPPHAVCILQRWEGQMSSCIIYDLFIKSSGRNPEQVQKFQPWLQ